MSSGDIDARAIIRMTTVERRGGMQMVGQVTVQHVMIMTAVQAGTK
jgi:hypothetical protein